MLEKYEIIIKEICSKHGVGLYDIEEIKTLHGNVLCVFITKIGGVNISDCVKVSKDINTTIETNEILKGYFTFEVSSPGIERQLKFKKHYASAINEWVSVKLGERCAKPHSTDGKTQNEIIGLLKEVNHEFVTIETEKENIQVPFTNIKKAKTIYKQVKKENK
ncbi:MAG: hypothetical protein FWG98_09935 [Candidatus Cloacimonetes bacterium]|nr:hypothetical protein [Candidatus Cloacimonadota bacterium]